MKRLSYILSHPLYRSSYEKTMEEEKDRIFCCHQMDHLLAVARIAWIKNLEENQNFPKSVIYAAALLHDIGKYAQYKDGIPHEIKSRELAETILNDLPDSDSYTPEECEWILTAIEGHRRLRSDPTALEKLLYESDKLSRNCFSCSARQDCNWSTTKKNMEIII